MRWNVVFPSAVQKTERLHPTFCASATHTPTMKPQTDAFFISERRGPLSRKTAWVAIREYGKRAGLPVEAHPHMLRHACGFALADQGADTRLIQDYLGHRNIQHTVMYTATKPARFERLWR